MKNVLLTQTTEYDCGPTTLVNALRFLFEREDIPPALIRTIWLHTNDTYDERGQKGCRGTSKACVRYLCEFFNDYGEHCHFPIRAAFTDKEAAEIAPGSAAIRCLETGGVVMIRCWLENCPHYVLLTGIMEQGVALFDPYEDTQFYDWEQDGVLRVEDEPRRWNRIVTMDRLNAVDNQDYAMGEVCKRESLLIWNSATEKKA